MHFSPTEENLYFCSPRLIKEDDYINIGLNGEENMETSEKNLFSLDNILIK